MSTFVNLLELVYPIGAVYQSWDNTSPATTFGGTWTQITGRFLYANTSSGSTGGANTVTLTSNQIPSHKHTTYETYSGRVGENGSGSTDGIVWGVRLSNTWSVSTGATGGGAAHQNMPAYISCYCWRRTA